MCKKGAEAAGPQGGIQVNKRTVRGWRWDADGKLTSRPVRCRRDDWYLARARLHEGSGLDQAAVTLAFLQDDVVIDRRCLRLHAPHGPARNGTLLGWMETPEEATHLQLCLEDESLGAHIETLTLYDVAERDPKCHPLANVPRWSRLRPPFNITRVILPQTLHGLGEHLAGVAVEVCDPPKSVAALSRLVRGQVCVLDASWIRSLRLSLAQVEELAGSAWVIVDLDSMARLLRAARVAEVRLETHESDHGLMSARIEYGDVATRGFAMQDVVPYAVVAADEFRMRVLRASRPWKKYADEVGCATLLSSETPWAKEHGDVLSAARPIGSGELLATDLPWLVAGKFGPLIAPRLAVHLLRMHLGLPLGDHLQFWNRWEDGQIVVRDLGDLTRRYPELSAVRWASDTPGCEHLGVAYVPGQQARRQVMFCTGRIDSVGVHDGIPPEPLAIFMKWLAREAREQTAWARKHLADQIVTWQFDTHEGHKYALNFEAATKLDDPAPTVVRLRRAGDSAARGSANEVLLKVDEGIHGDGSFEFQQVLTVRLKRLIERSRGS